MPKSWKLLHLISSHHYIYIIYIYIYIYIYTFTVTDQVLPTLECITQALNISSTTFALSSPNMFTFAELSIFFFGHLP
jgi:hypothetical protein